MVREYFHIIFGISSQALMDLALLTATLLLPIRGCCFDPFHQVSILILQALMVAKAALITGTVTIFGLATLGLALAVRPYNYSFLSLSNVGGQGEEDGSNGVITYKAAAVPGPVPILGALAALRCSRTLRKRCRFQASKSVAS